MQINAHVCHNIQMMELGLLIFKMYKITLFIFVLISGLKKGDYRYKYLRVDKNYQL